MSFIETKNQPYWLPVDAFIFKLMETHGSLAMLTPRIQSPWDMVRWDEIKHDNYEKFMFARALKKFYLEYLKKNSIMGNNDLFKNGKLVFDPKVDDRSLLKHPPVLGHWLSASHFLEESDYTKDHEYSYSEYMRVFSLSGRNKERHHLFPSFEAILVENKKSWREETVDHDKRYENIDFTALFAQEKILPGYFYSDQGLQSTYEFSCFNSIKILETGCPLPENYVELVGESESKVLFCKGEPVVSIINEVTYNPSKLTDQGFLDTPINIAYMMGFDIKSQYEVETYINGGYISRSRLHGNEYKTEVRGRIRKRTECDCSIPDNTCMMDNFVYYPLSISKEITYNNSDKIDPKKFSELKVVKNDVVYSRDQSCFRDIQEYLAYEDKLGAEFNAKPMINYFWFMYGCLPVNNILYEDLDTIDYMNSVLDLTDPNSYWTIDRRTIIKGYKTKIPTDYDKGYYLKIQQQWMRFLGLVFGVKKTDFKHVLDFYYIDNSSRNVKIEKIHPDLLNSVYPKITSSKKSTKPIVSDRLEDKGIPNPTKDEKLRANGILNKVLYGSLSQNDLNDLTFMKEHNLLSPTGNTIYDQFMEDKSEELFKALKEDITQNSRDLLQTFISKPAKEEFRRVVPADILELSKKLMSPTKDAPIDDDVIDKIRTIIHIILNDQTEVVSKNMILYLEAWGIIPHQEFKYIKVDNFEYLFDLNKIRDPKYEAMVKNLDSSGFEGRDLYEGKRGKDLSGQFDKYQPPNQNRDQNQSNRGGGIKTNIDKSGNMLGMIYGGNFLDKNFKEYLEKYAKGDDKVKFREKLFKFTTDFIAKNNLDKSGNNNDHNNKLASAIKTELGNIKPDNNGDSFKKYIT